MTAGLLRRVTPGLALSFVVAGLWALTHRFEGLHGDGELYAFQALAKLHPALNADVYLAFNSQDRYTVFSSIYAFFIARSNLQTAEAGLFCFCTILFFCGAYRVSHKLFGVTVGGLTVGLLVIVHGDYGAYGVFSYSEDFLTARSLTVALVVSSLALHMSGRPVKAGFVATTALLVHPIMALPGALLLICLNLPLRVCIAGATLGCLTILGLALAASNTPMFAQHLPIMDAAWLEVVRERSEFLFLNYWRTVDWELTARPFASLALAAFVATDARVRKLCLVAMLIGATGLIVALIAGSIGPVAILVQGQAWRWTWLVAFVAVFLLAPTALALWRDKQCGPLVAVLLILGWTWNQSGVDNLLLVELAVALWLLKDSLAKPTARIVDFTVSHRVRNSIALSTSTVSAAGQRVLSLIRNHSAAAQSGLIAALLISIVFVVSSSLKQSPSLARGNPGEVAEFADWRRQIPPTSNVLLIPLPTSAAFAWVTLNRPSYISVNQSSGVVFARATALEIRRRSEVLQPIAEPDWKIMTRINARKLSKQTHEIPTERLTVESLARACADPQLGFVVAKENVGYAPFRHNQAGPWKDWNLYDCGQIRMPVHGI
jgi:hypothetical protein